MIGASRARMARTDADAPMKPLLLYLPLLCLSAAATAAAPSFNCGKAVTPIEVLVCGSDALSKLDARLAEVYDAAQDELPRRERAEQKKRQLQWLAERDACAAQDETDDCVADSYEARIAQLQVVAGQLPVPEPTPYDCPRLGRVTAQFYAGAQVPLAVLRIGRGAPLYAVNAPNGSGLRYAVGDLAFWTKDEVAVISRNGHADEHCRLRSVSR